MKKNVIFVILSFYYLFLGYTDTIVQYKENGEVLTDVHIEHVANGFNDVRKSLISMEWDYLSGIEHRGISKIWKLDNKINWFALNQFELNDDEIYRINYKIPFSNNRYKVFFVQIQDGGKSYNYEASTFWFDEKSQNDKEETGGIGAILMILLISGGLILISFFGFIYCFIKLKKISLKTLNDNDETITTEDEEEIKENENNVL